MSKFVELREIIDDLEKLMTHRHNLDKCSTLVTDGFLVFRKIADEVGRNQSLFSDAPKSKSDEEDDKEVVAVDTRTPLAALMEGDGEGEPEEISKSTWELIALLRQGAIQDAAWLLQCRLNDAIRHARLVTIRTMIRHIWQGAVNPWEMMKHALAITREYQKTHIRGISFTELALLLDETKAATSARAKKLHYELLKRWGVKGYKNDGGLKSEEACAKYSKAAKGNTNRADGEKAKRERAAAAALAASRADIPAEPAA